MRILGIETSCDDTSIGIITDQRGKIVVETTVTASQILIHRKYGGVVPEVAAREHAVTILPTIEAALKKARRTWQDIDAIAVTAGPGLNTALVVGVETARNLAYLHQKKLLRINHIEGHICSTWASPEAKNISFPAVALVVSGGHTELIRIPKFGQYKLLGRTLDDAVGEAFDKTAKLLGLPYPGGPSISKLALTGNNRAWKFPQAMMNNKSLDFSYSGLKTSVLYAWRDAKKTSATKRDIAASFQQAAIDPLVTKTAWALEKTRARTLLLAGGVSANAILRQELSAMVSKKFPGVAYVQPVLSLCTDNGTMIAIAGAFRARKKEFTPWQKIAADPNWELV